MNGNMAIDFKPGPETVPHILQTIDREGYDLCGLHLIPSCAERWTLMVDLRSGSGVTLDRLEHQLNLVGGVIEVIHTTSSQRSAVAAAA